jgi:predicted dehydrogenase
VTALRGGDLRIAIIGYGFAGRVFHSSLISATPGLRVAGIVARRPEAAAEAAARFPRAAVCGDPEDVFAHADLYNGVVIATPNAFHVPLALRAIAVGLPVVIDKPLAQSAAEAQRVADAAGRAGAPVTVFQNRRFDSEILTLRRLAGDLDIGRKVRFDSTYGFFRPEIERSWREVPPTGSAPAGMLFDIGAHVVDQAVHLFGPIARVYGEVRAARAGARVPDDFFIAAQHAGGGPVSHLRGGLIQSANVPRLTLQGTRGSIQVEDQDPQEAQLQAGLAPDHPAFGVMDKPFATHVDATGRAHRLPAVAGDQTKFYRLWRQSLLGEGPPPVDIGSAVHTLGVLEAALRSSAEHLVVEVAQPPAGVQP